MRKYNEFELIKINDKEYFVITKSYEGFLNFYKKVERYLNKIAFNGLVYVDQLSILNNSYNRFAKIDFTHGKLDFKTAKHLPLGEEYKKITSDFFYKNQDLLDNTIMNSSYKEKIINKEIV